MRREVYMMKRETRIGAGYDDFSDGAFLRPRMIR
jgi:hypothetical protein